MVVVVVVVEVEVVEVEVVDRRVAWTWFSLHVTNRQYYIYIMTPNFCGVLAQVVDTSN